MTRFEAALDLSERSDGELATSCCVDAVGRAAGGALEYGRRIPQFSQRFRGIHLTERQDGVPERKPAPLSVAIAHGPQMPRASADSLLPSTEAAREKISPQSHAALPAAEQPRVRPARVECGPLETAHQPVARPIERCGDHAVAHAERLQRTAGLLADDVPRRCRGDALAREDDNALVAFRGKAGEGVGVGAGQTLPGRDPSCDLPAFGDGERSPVKPRRVNRIDRLRKTC